MTRSIYIAVLALAVLCTPVSANAQFGRLIEPQNLLALFSEGCTSSAPSFAAKLPPKANARKWDELGRTAAAHPGDRGWLVSIHGLPAIVDISRPAGGGETCSTSAVSDPDQIVSALTKLLQKRPDSTVTQNTRAGPTLVRFWNPSKRFPYPLKVTSTPGQAMTRITITIPGRR